MAVTMRGMQRRNESMEKNRNGTRDPGVLLGVPHKNVRRSEIVSSGAISFSLVVFLPHFQPSSAPFRFARGKPFAERAS